MNESFGTESYQDPVAVIEGIRAEIMATGAVDIEGAALDQIRQEYEEGKIEGAEAIRRAREVQANRQDYH